MPEEPHGDPKSEFLIDPIPEHLLMPEEPHGDPKSEFLVDPIPEHLLLPEEPHGDPKSEFLIDPIPEEPHGDPKSEFLIPEPPHGDPIPPHLLMPEEPHGDPIPPHLGGSFIPNPIDDTIDPADGKNLCALLGEYCQCRGMVKFGFGGKWSKGLCVDKDILCVDVSFSADRNDFAGKPICVCDDDKHHPDNDCFTNGLIHVESTSESSDGDSSDGFDIGHAIRPGQPGFVNGKGPLPINLGLGTRPGEPGFVNGKGPLPIKFGLGLKPGDAGFVNGKAPLLIKPGQPGFVNGKGPLNVSKGSRFFNVNFGLGAGPGQPGFGMHGPPGVHFRGAAKNTHAKRDPLDGHKKCASRGRACKCHGKVKIGFGGNWSDWKCVDKVIMCNNSQFTNTKETYGKPSCVCDHSGKKSHGCNFRKKKSGGLSFGFKGRGPSFGLGDDSSSDDASSENRLFRRCAVRGRGCRCNGRARFGHGQNWTQWKCVKNGKINCNASSFGLPLGRPPRGAKRICQCDDTGINGIGNDCPLATLDLMPHVDPIPEPYIDPRQLEAVDPGFEIQTKPLPFELGGLSAGLHRDPKPL